MYFSIRNEFIDHIYETIDTRGNLNWRRVYTNYNDNKSYITFKGMFRFPILFLTSFFCHLQEFQGTYRNRYSVVSCSGGGASVGVWFSR